MRGTTHLAFAGFVGVVGAGFGVPPGTIGGAALAVGALLPDIDTTTSGIGRFSKPLSSYLERKLGHRTVTHSLLGLGLFAIVSSPLLLVAPTAWVWLLVGVLSHSLLDTANVTGVPLLWPARVEFVLLHNRGARVVYGSPREHWWLATFALGALVLAPLSRDGFSPWFHRFLGTPNGAVQDYLRWRDEHEVWADVTGHNLLSGEAVSDRFRVIDAMHTEQIVVEDLAGRAYRVGLGGDSDIIAERVVVSRGERVMVRVDRLEVGGRTVAELIAALPRGARRVYVTGVLFLHGTVDELPAVAGWMKRVEVVGRETWLRAASAADLSWLALEVIERGSLVVRAEYGVGSDVAGVELAEGPGRVFTIRLPGLPSLAGLLVDVGDVVVAGQPIARYVDDAAVERAEAAVERARRELVVAEAALAGAEEVAAAERERWAADVQRAQDDLERTRRLVDAGARPAIEAVEAAGRLENSNRRELEGLTQWTSDRSRLVASVERAVAEVVAAEGESRRAVEKQWVRVEVPGVVVRVALNSGARGLLDVELLLLTNLPRDGGVSTPQPTTSGSARTSESNEHERLRALDLPQFMFITRSRASDGRRVWCGRSAPWDNAA